MESQEMETINVPEDTSGVSADAEQEAEFDIAIDFGTCNLKVACYDASLKTNMPGEIDRIEELSFTKAQDTKILPNTANITKDNTRIGKRGKSSEPETSVSNLKQHIEDENWSIYVPQRDREMKMMEVLSESFAWIRQEVHAQRNKYPKEVVITAPVCFSETQKNRLRKAAQQAGFANPLVIEEPFAAMFSNWSLLQSKEKDYYHALVFDFGGGTLDMSIFCVRTGEQTRLQTLASRGLMFGGENITKMMFEELVLKEHQDVVDKLIERHFQRLLSRMSEEDRQPDSPEYQKSYETQKNIIMSKLLEAMTDLKESVSATAEKPQQTDEYYTTYDELDELDITCSYQKLTEMLDNYKIPHLDSCTISDKIISMLDLLIDAALIIKEDIHKIIMVGGTSEIPYFRKLLEQYFGLSQESAKNIFVEVDSQRIYTAVSMGAMIYLKARNTQFIVENLLSYEVGFFREGKYYERLRTMDTTLDEWSARKVVYPEKDEGILKVKLYQLFHDSIKEHITPDAPQDAIYLGYFRLDAEEFTHPYYFMDIQAGEKGEFFGRFYDPTKKVETNKPMKILKLIMEG